MSLTQWLGAESILVLGNSHQARPAIRAINQVLFTRLAGADPRPGRIEDAAELDFPG